MEAFPTATENDVAEEKISAATEEAQIIQDLENSTFRQGTKISEEATRKVFLLTSILGTQAPDAPRTVSFKHQVRLIIWPK